MSKKYSEKNIIGNSSTIVKYFLVMLATKTITVAAAHGINLPVDAQALAAIFGWILGFIIATIDAKYPNNIFNTILVGMADDDENETDITFTEDSGEGDDY